MRKAWLLMPSIVVVLSTGAAADATFDPAARILSLPVLNSAGQEYRDVELRLDADGRWSISRGPTDWAERDQAATVSETCGPEHITKARFAAVEFGMTFDDAIAVVGCEGELVAEGMDGGAHVKAYHFEHGISNFDLWFKEGAVANKRQTIYESD